MSSLPPDLAPLFDDLVAKKAGADAADAAKAASAATLAADQVTDQANGESQLAAHQATTAALGVFLTQAQKDFGP